MNSINLEFKLSIEKDIVNILKYRNLVLHGLEYRKSIEKLHPGIYSLNEEEIKAYIEQFYEENKNKILADMKDTKNIWSEIQEDFQTKLNMIFNENISLNVEINPSIINNNPVFLEENRFMYGFNLKKEEKKLVLVHELMHLAFNKFAKTNNILIPEKKIWKILESLNYVIINKPEFKEIIAPLEDKTYPDIMEKEIELREIRNKNFNILEIFNQLKTMWR